MVSAYCRLHQSCRLLALALVVLCALPAAGSGVAPGADPHPRLRIDAGTTGIDLWPEVQVLVETGRPLSPQEALERAAEFVSPKAPHANLGVQREVVWLLMRLDIADDAPLRWMFDVAYPSIDSIRVYQVDGGTIVREIRMGDHLPLGERPLPSRTHAVALEFVPGRVALLLRVRTTSSMVLPLTLLPPPEYHAREAGIEALQGMFAGIAVFLLIYSLVHWIALRDRIFGYYAVAVGGVALFFLAYNGLAAEHLWPRSPWLTDNAAPLSVLLGLWGGLLFLERILRVATLSPTVSRLMVAFAWVALAVGTAFTLGFIDYGSAQVVSTVLGPVPMLLAVPIAYVRMRRGDRMMVYLLAGWALFAFGVAVMAALLRGMAPWNAFTQNAFQVGSMAEMTLWLVLLGQRVAQIRRVGQEARREHDALRSLALTDALTGLPNRRGLAPVLADAVNHSRPGQQVAIYMADLDGFKQVNDVHGHDAGDRLLIAVAERFRQTVRRSDFVARLGGDEFVVIVAGFGADAEARQFGEKLIEAFDPPFRLPGDTVCRIGLTVGYVLAPRDGTDAQALLRGADEAMYAGKLRGKHCIHPIIPPAEPGCAGPATPPSRATAHGLAAALDVSWQERKFGSD